MNINGNCRIKVDEMLLYSNVVFFTFLPDHGIIEKVKEEEEK